MAAAALPIPSNGADAEGYPTRPIRWVVGFPPGGPADTIARLMGQWMSKRLGQPVVIDNRAGAASNLAAEAVVRAPPDGYTLLYVSIVNAINASLYAKLNLDIVHDIAPVAGIAAAPSAMVINPSVPARTVSEFIAYAKANPGRIAFASVGNGSPQHVYGALFKTMAGIDMLHIPYRGSASALTDLLSGQVQLMFESLLSVTGYIRDARLRSLAVTSLGRVQSFPELPTLSEFPRNTPVEIINRLNGEINAGLADPEIRSRLSDFGNTPLLFGPQEFGKFARAEIEKWGKVVKLAGATAD